MNNNLVSILVGCTLFVMGTPMAFSAPIITATKTDSLFSDINNNGVVNPGDTLQYSVEITNLGDQAIGVSFSDTLDPNTSLIVGSVNTGAGTVIKGNAAGDTTVEVDIGPLLLNNVLTLVFQAIVNDPFPMNLTEVANQGLVAGDNFTSILTDDPDSDGIQEPTVTQVARAVPEPSMLAVLGIGLAGMGCSYRRRNRAKCTA